MKILLLCLIIPSTFAALLHADINFKNGKFRTDNSSQTDIKLDPDNDGTAEAILDAGGNLGLGTLTPSANVDVAGDVFVSGELIIGGNVLLSNGNLQDGLVRWWGFDGPDASGNLIDLTGQGYDGTLTNGPVWVDGKFGKAIEFDGTDDYMAIDSDTDLPLGNADRTLAAWFMASSYSSQQIISWGTDTATKRSELGLRASNSIVFAVNTGAYKADYTAPTDTWIHAVAVFSGTKVGEVRFYINGVQQSVSLQAGGNVNVDTIAAGQMQLGVDSDRNADYFSGKIDDVRIYNRVLSQKEITTLYTHGQSKLAAGGTISDNLIVTGNVSITDPLNFNSITEPSTPNAGQVYSNGSNLQFYNGTSWVNLTAAGNTAWTQPGSGNLLYNNGSVTMGSITDKLGTLIVGNGGSSDNILTLDDNGASVFTVADGGSVGIGTTSPSQKVDVVGTAGFGATSVGGNITISDNIMPSANITYDIGTNAASLNTAYSTDYVLLSDKRLKAGVKEAGHALERISKLRPVQFQFKDTPHLTRLGLIAQEVENVVPEAVSTGTGSQGIKAVSYHELTVLLLAAQKEEMNEIDNQFEKLHERLLRIQGEREKLMGIMQNGD